MSLIEWSGDLVEGRAVLERLRAEIAPAASSLDDVPFLVMQTMGDEVFGHGLLSYIKATFADELTDGLIDVLVERAGSLGSPLTQVEVLSLGGAIARVPADATAFVHRDARWLINVPASWADPAESEREIAWVRDTFAALSEHTSGGAYVNFMEARRARFGRGRLRRDPAAAAGRQGADSTRRTCSPSTRTSCRR